MDADVRLRLTVDRVRATLGELVEQLQVAEDELRAPLGFLVDRPFFTYAYDCTLIPATSKEGAGDGS